MLGKVIRKTSSGGGKGFGDVVRYVARDRDDQADLRERFGSPEMGAINLDCPLDAREDRQTAIDILDATAAAKVSRRQTGHPAYHIEFSWQQGEHPTREQAAQAAAHVMRSVGMAEHQAVWAIHRDTDNDHVHLVINRVHPDTHRVQEVPHRDWLRLDKAMREIEAAQGWRHDNGPWIAVQREEIGQKPEFGIVRMSRTERARRGLLQDPDARVSDKAQRAEQNIGTDAFQRWIAGSPARAIKATLNNPGATWATIHQTAAQYGCVIQPKGSGMIVTTTLDDGRVLAAKASQLGRWASKAELEKRLGPYLPPGTAQIRPSLTYQRVLDSGKTQLHGPGGDSADRTEKRLERQAARKELADRFKLEQTSLRAKRPALRKALTERHRAERQALTAELRQMRAEAIAEHRRDGMPPQVAISYQAWVAAARREELQKRQAAERRALAARTPRTQVWRTWLEQQAEQGDEAAKAALRGIRYREQRAKNKRQDGIEGEELDPLRKLTVAALHAEIDHKRQLVIYRGQDGREKFTDTGPRIVMHDKKDDSLEAALRVAAQKYGGKVDITGSSEFRERAARQAVRLGIKVANEDLQAVVADEQARIAAERMARRTAPVQSAERPSTDSVDKPAPHPAQPAPQRAGSALPEKQAPTPARALFVSRPSNADALCDDLRQADQPPEKIRVVGDMELSPSEYDKFTADFSAPQPWLDGKGGIEEDGSRHVIEVTAQDRQTLHIDPAGYAYARYVGIPEADVQRVVDNRSLSAAKPRPLQAQSRPQAPALHPQPSAQTPPPPQAAPSVEQLQPPRVQRPDATQDVLVRWWNPKGQNEKKAWGDLAEQRSGVRGYLAAWHTMRDYVDAGVELPDSITLARALDERQQRRQRDRGMGR